MFTRRRESRAEKKELEAAYITLRRGGPDTGEPWDVIERLIVDWPAVREAWGTVERITGAEPDVDRCHPYVIRRYLYATRDLNKAQATYEEAMWGEGIDDTHHLCDTGWDYDAMERSLLKHVAIVSRGRMRKNFLASFTFEERVYLDQVRAREAADLIERSTGIEMCLLRADLLREDRGWMIAPRAAVDEKRRLIKRDG